MMKAGNITGVFESRRARRAYGAHRFEAKPPTHKRKNAMKTIAQLQAEFCKAYQFNTPTADQMSPTGEIDGDFITVYKWWANEPWLFKAAVPLSANSARAVAAYLAGLDEISPDYVNKPERSMNVSSSSNRAA